MVKNKEILKSSIIKGFSTLIIREFFIKIFSLFGQLFLARLLAPEDFGIYVIIVFIVALFGFFSDFGLSYALIQKRSKPTPDELSAVFTLKLILAVALIFALWFSAPLFKFFYLTLNDSNILMIRIFSLTLIFTAIKTVPVSMLERDLKYDKVSMIDIIGILVYYITAVPAAFLGLGVWSFIYASITKELIESISVSIISNFVPRINFRIGNIKKLIKFGAYIQGNHLATFSMSSITPVIGGGFLGAYSVGLIDFSNKLTSLPATIAMNFARVAFAGYSRIQEEKELLFRSIDKSISLLSIPIYFFPVIFFAFGPELIKTLYTDKWLPALPALYVLVIGAFFHPVNSAIGQGILSVGLSRDIFRATFVIAVVGWMTALLLTGRLGFVSIAITITVMSFLSGIFYIVIFSKTGYKLPLKEVILPKLLVFIFTLIFSFTLNYLFPTGFIFLILKLLLSGLFYLCLSYMFGKTEVKELIDIGKSLLFKKNG